MDARNLHLLHLLLIAPFLTYIASMNLLGNPVSRNVYIALLVLGVYVALYHGRKLLNC